MNTSHIDTSRLAPVHQSVGIRANWSENFSLEFWLEIVRIDVSDPAHIRHWDTVEEEI